MDSSLSCWGWGGESRSRYSHWAHTWFPLSFLPAAPAPTTGYRAQGDHSRVSPPKQSYLFLAQTTSEINEREKVWMPPAINFPLWLVTKEKKKRLINLFVSLFSLPGINFCVWCEITVWFLLFPFYTQISSSLKSFIEKRILSPQSGLPLLCIMSMTV